MQFQMNGTGAKLQKPANIAIFAWYKNKKKNNKTMFLFRPWLKSNLWLADHYAKLFSNISKHSDHLFFKFQHTQKCFTGIQHHNAATKREWSKNEISMNTSPRQRSQTPSGAAAAAKYKNSRSRKRDYVL